MSKAENAEGVEVSRAPRTEGWNELTQMIIGAAIEVHRETGPGLLESVYQECLCYELRQRGLKFKQRVPVPISYKGIKLQSDLRMDLVVEDCVVLELKTVDTILPVHCAQLLTYLKLSGKKLGLILNFNEPVLKKGIKRLVNHFEDSRELHVTSAPSALDSGEDRTSRTDERTPSKTLRLSVSAVKNVPPVK